MKPVACEFEAEVLASVLQYRWPDRVDSELRDHAVNCTICSEVAAIAAGFQEVRETAKGSKRQASLVNDSMARGLGGPRVDLAALVELERLLIGVINAAQCRSDIAIVPEESNAVSQSVGRGAGSAADPVIRQHQAGRAGRCGAGQDHFGVGSDPHAGDRPQRRGA